MDSESTPRSLINSPQHISNSQANLCNGNISLKETRVAFISVKNAAIKNHVAIT